VLGGAGNDRLSGGGGHNVLVGGAGSDILEGGPLADILIGDAADRISGGREDLLVGSPVKNQENLAALALALDQWLAGDRAGALDALNR